MKKICFYFQVHQPYRVSKYSVFNVGLNENYFDGPPEATNEAVFEKVANKCYLPANKLFLKLLKTHPEFKISYSLSGVFLEQCQQFGKIGKKVLDSFKKLVKTGQVELLGETSHHSLAAIYSAEEFKKQVKEHSKLIKKLFGVTPKVFRNTELIYNNDVALMVQELKFKGILLEGWDAILAGRSPNFVYRVPEEYKKNKNFGLLLKNYRLSDDIAFRFSDKNWPEHPLSIEKFVHWVHQNYGDTINLFMDYETFGEHQWEETGIFDFLEILPAACLESHIEFQTPSEALNRKEDQDVLNVRHHISWADMERDLSAWMGNSMQQSSLKRVYDLEKKVTKVNKPEVFETWRKLQTSDHFYYMSTKFWADGDVHKYFSPFSSPYEAFMHYTNVITDFEKYLDKLLNE